MKKSTLWVAETGLLLALLIVLQNVTKPMGQLVTGSCVNAVLAISVLMTGWWSGVTIAAVSPVLAFLLGIAPNIVVVPAIMIGNLVFVLALRGIAGPSSKKVARQVIAWLVAAGLKFATLYGLVAWLICNVLSSRLMAAGFLKEPMLKALPATFGVPQLITALIGGAVALLIVAPLRKALHR